MRILGALAILLAAAGAAQADAPAPTLTLEGPMEQGALVIGEAAPGATATLDGTPLMMDKSGRFVFGFDRDAPAEAKLSVRWPDGSEEVRTLNVAPRAWNIQSIEGLPPQQVNPTPEQLERIKREAAMKHDARRPDTKGAWFAEKFIWPAEGPITGIFGSQRILNGEPRAPHYGVDMAVPDGTPVKAPAGGIVRLAEKDFYFEGGVVFIDHGHGLTSYMMHMSRVDAKAGDVVKRGDVIGASGHTGRATGPHVHWGMFWMAAHIDPQLLVPAAPGTPPAPVVPNAPGTE